MLYPIETLLLERRTYCLHILQKDYIYSQVQRVQVDSHLQSALRHHLDLACVKLTNTEAKLNNTEAKLDITSAKLNDAHIKLNETEEKLEATQKVVEKLETRKFVWKISNFSVALREAKINRETPIDSIPFYADRTESFGCKLKVRIYPNFQGSVCSKLLVIIVIMKGEYDAILPWPFKMKVTCTLIDQQKDPVKRKNVTRLLDLDKNPEAFARPVKEENNGCLILYLDHKTLHSRRYLADDTLFIQVEVSPP